MRRLPILFFSLAMCAAMVVGSSYGQDKKAAKDPPQVQLPKYWSKIGIGEAQKTKIYDVLRTYQVKIDALEKQIDQLKTDRYDAAYKLLNDAQKEELRIAEKGAGKDKDKDKGKDTDQDRKLDTDKDKKKKFDSN